MAAGDKTYRHRVVRTYISNHIGNRAVQYLRGRVSIRLNVGI